MESIKTYTLYAGVNGAGKSTLYSFDKLQSGIRLNSDELVREMGGDWKDMKVQIEAGKRLLKKQAEAFEKGLSINRETTLCGNNIYNSVLKAKALGYTIDLRYIGVASPEIAKSRVAKRIALGGHGVSEETIERRYSSSADGFIAIYPYCDRVTVYDNSGAAPVLAAYLLDGKMSVTNVRCEWVEELLKRI